MKRKFKKTALAVVLSASFLFSGCSVSLSVDELMRPPRLTEQQEEIHNALIEHTGNSGLKLKYPRSGDHKSAFVMYDIDSDNEEEAIVFYDGNTAGNTNAEASICVNVLDKVENQWKLVSEYTYSCSDIDMLDFIHNNDGSVSIAIGYITGLSEKMLDVYEYNTNRLEQIYQVKYTKLYVCDADLDGIDEMLVFNNNYVSKTSNLQVIEPEESFKVTATVDMQPDISEITNIVGSKTENGFLLYIDELKVSNMLNTEVIEFSKGKVKNLTYHTDEKLIENLRANGIYSADIDNDSEIEIPCASVLPGYEPYDKDKQQTAIQWLKVKNGDVSRKYYSYYNINDGYLFVFPERWVGLVTVRIDKQNDEVVFVKYEGSDIGLMKELMRIKAMPKGIALSEKYTGYMIMAQDSENDFYVKLSDDKNEPLVLTSTEASFSLSYTIEK